MDSRASAIRLLDGEELRRGLDVTRPDRERCEGIRGRDHLRLGAGVGSAFPSPSERLSIRVDGTLSPTGVGPGDRESNVIGSLR